MALSVNVFIFTGFPNLLPDQIIPTDIVYIQQVDFIDDIPRKKTDKPMKAMKQESFKERVIPEKHIKSFTQKTAENIDMDIPDIKLSASMDIDMGVSMPEPRVQTGPLLKGYYNMGQVDQTPVATIKGSPPYPYRARRLNLNGDVDIKFLVDESGRVSQLTILKATPPNIFDQSVRDTVSRWRFEPGKVAGKAVNTWMTTTIEFRMSEL